MRQKLIAILLVVFWPGLLLKPMVAQRDVFFAQNTQGSVITGLNPCLVSAWPMNEGTTLTLHDTSGHSNNATINNSGTVAWQSNAGFPGTTLFWNGSFSGSGLAAATSTTLTNFTNTQPFSASFWMSTVSTLDQVYLSTLDPSSGFKGWEMAFGSGTHTVGLTVVNNSPSNQLYVSGSTVLSDGALHYVVATYDGTQLPSGVRIYVDGVAETLTTNINTLSATSASGIPVNIANRSGGTLPVIGALAFAEVYNCVLTPTQVTTYHSAGPGIY